MRECRWDCSHVSVWSLDNVSTWGCINWIFIGFGLGFELDLDSHRGILKGDSQGGFSRIPLSGPIDLQGIWRYTPLEVYKLSYK